MKVICIDGELIIGEWWHASIETAIRQAELWDSLGYRGKVVEDAA